MKSDDRTATAFRAYAAIRLAFATAVILLCVLTVLGNKIELNCIPLTKHNIFLKNLEYSFIQQ
jgi:hypothetical protein